MFLSISRSGADLCNFDVSPIDPQMQQLPAPIELHHQNATPTGFFCILFSLVGIAGMGREEAKLNKAIGSPVGR